MLHLPLWWQVIPDPAEPPRPLLLSQSALLLRLFARRPGPVPTLAQEQDVLVLVGHVPIARVVRGAHPLAPAGGVRGRDLAPDDIAHEVEADLAPEDGQVSGDRLHAVAAVLAGAQVLVADVHRHPAALVQHAVALAEHLAQRAHVVLVCLFAPDLLRVPVVLYAPVRRRGDDEVHALVLKFRHLLAVAEDDGMPCPAAAHSCTHLSPTPSPCRCRGCRSPPSAAVRCRLRSLRFAVPVCRSPLPIAHCPLPAVTAPRAPGSAPCSPRGWTRPARP